eukprot:5418318-Alexandrium_andersonii.AAC.1
MAPPDSCTSPDPPAHPRTGQAVVSAARGRRESDPPNSAGPGAGGFSGILRGGEYRLTET